MNVAPERTQPVPATPPGVSGAVVLATLAVPFDPAGERMAIDSALETGAQLVLVNVRDMPHAPMTTMLCGPDGATFPHEEALDEVRASARRAAALGLQTLLLRVGTHHPARALLEVAADQSASLLVFAPDRGAIGTRRFRRTARAVRRKAGCLVWVTLDDRAGSP
jgi:nucleotide-binding universal stress UspA family protein